MQTKKYHLIVIGAGSGGLVAAAGAAGLAEVSKRIADTYQRNRLTPNTKKWLARYFKWRFK